MPNPDWGHSKGGRVSVLPCRAVPCSVWVSPCGCPRRPMAAGRSRGQQGTGTQLVRSWQLGSCLEQGPSLGLHIRWSSAAGRLPLPVPMQARAWTARFGQLPASALFVPGAGAESKDFRNPWQVRRWVNRTCCCGDVCAAQRGGKGNALALPSPTTGPLAHPRGGGRAQVADQVPLGPGTAAGNRLMVFLPACRGWDAH